MSTATKPRPAQMAELLKRVHQYILEEAQRLGVTITDVCKAADVERSHVMRWKVTLPKSVDTLWKLMDALDRIEQGQGIEHAGEPAADV